MYECQNYECKTPIRYYLTPKIKKGIVEKECWNCGHIFQGLRNATCPRCKGGQLTPDKWRNIESANIPAPEIKNISG